MTESNIDIKVFAYGTLMNPEVIEELLHKEPHYTPAVLMGWKRFRISGSPYFLLPDDGGAVQGLVLSRLTVQDMVELDTYESIADGLYDRKIKEVLTDNSITRAYFYVAGESFLDHLDKFGYLEKWGYRRTSTGAERTAIRV